ncbi:antitoxin [Synergistales bacterium]|nr:antitoxin [Synergistales bacterium]
MKNKVEVIIQKLIVHVEKIGEYCKSCESIERFTANPLIVEACVFNLSQIGELTKRLDEDFCASHTDVPWERLYGLRNRIVHDYEGINFSRIWSIIRDDLPILKRQLMELLLINVRDNGQ